MARRHLHELLREEQEPFALKRFIDERRVQLRRPFSRDSPPSRHRHNHHLQIRRNTPAVTESRAFSPSALLKSPSSSSSSAPFAPFREPLDGKKSPLLHLPLEKSPSLASRLTTALLLEAAVRIQKQQEQQQQSRRKRRKRKKKKENQSPSKRLGLGFLSSILKRLVVRKRQRGTTGEDEVEAPFSGPAKAFLKWEARHGENAGERSMQMARNQHKEADLDVRNPHCGSQTDQEERKHGEGDLLQSSICCRRGVPECPRKDGDRSPWVSDSGSVLPGTGRVSSPNPSQELRPGPSPSRDPSPELQTPAASPDRRKTEGQLFRGTGDDGRPESSYYEEKKEQFSPVSVLDPPFDEEEDHQRDDDSHHPELEAQEEDGERAVEEDEAADVDSFQHSLTIVQRAKRQLLSRIRRFERLAELDPVELERRLVEEEDEGGEHGGCGGPEATVGRLHDSVEMEASDVRELVQAVLGFSGCAGRKIPADARRLVLDLAEEERRDGTGPMAARLTDGVEKSTVEGVRWRFEAWKGLESNTIDMMVGMDLRQEGDGWRRYAEQVREAAAAVEAAVFTLLVDELTEEFVHGCID